MIVGQAAHLAESGPKVFSVLTMEKYFSSDMDGTSFLPTLVNDNNNKMTSRGSKPATWSEMFWSVVSKSFNYFASSSRADSKGTLSENPIVKMSFILLTYLQYHKQGSINSLHTYNQYNNLLNPVRDVIKRFGRKLRFPQD